jgi:undecaprenyl-diphosphatase
VSVVQAIILGIVQGLTEFLPVSSSGHLILVPWLMGWGWYVDPANADLNKTFDVALHLGTFIAVLAYFWREVGQILAAWFHTLRTRRAKTPTERLAWLLLISTIPAGLVGVALESFIEDQLGKPYLICIMMIVFALVMLAIDRLAKLDRSTDDLRWPGALGIGVAQAIALSPGVSRSSVTMMAGMLLRLDRESAARYSFLLSVPVIGGAAIVKGAKLAKDGLPAGTATPFAVGMAAAAVSGFAAIWFLLGYLKRHDFTVFVVYRIVVAVALLLLIAFGVRHATGL